MNAMPQFAAIRRSSFLSFALALVGIFMGTLAGIGFIKAKMPALNRIAHAVIALACFARRRVVGRSGQPQSTWTITSRTGWRFDVFRV